GANTAVYSWMDNLVLNPFPGIHEPGRIVGLETGFPDGDAGPVAFLTLDDWRRGSRSFNGIAAWAMTRVSGRREGEHGSTSLVTTLVSGNYFSVLGAAVAVGRAISADDEVTRTPVAVLGDAAWRRVFGADPAILGRPLYLNGEPFTVVGLAAPEFAGTYLGVVPDVFVPITLQPKLTGVDSLADRTARSYQALARLSPGVTVAAAARELDALARQVSDANGERPVLGAVVKEARRRYLGGLVSPILAATLVVTSLLLLVACANVAGLLLVRAATRWPEMSLRRALGASVTQVVRLVLIECLVLGAVGGLLGVSVACLSRDVLYAFIPTATFPITLPIALNGRVLALAAATAVVVSLLCGVVPALRLRRADPGSALRGTGRALAPRASWLRLVLLGGQVAVSLTCLVTAGLFLRGLHSAAAIDLGFEQPERVLLINTDLSPARIEPGRRKETVHAILREVRGVSGVDHASIASFVPLGFGGRRVSVVKVDGYAPRADEDMSVLRIAAGSEYAAAMSITLLEGREFTAADRDGQPVALVNAAFARRFWPGASALNRRIDFGTGWATIVGVLRDGKYGTLAETSQAVAYVNLEQLPVPVFTLHVRTGGAPLALVEPVRAALRRVQVDLPVLQPRTLADHISASTFVPRVGATVLSVFGAVALVLAAVGIHAAMAFAVAIRTRELGIRVALGAAGRDILRVVMHQALLVTGAGVITGDVLSAILGHVLRARLPELGQVPVFDAAAFGAGGLLLVAAAGLAALAPAVRALRVDPTIVLRDG
ncbi:MAG TPA: ADOP family duplicated permease, partial [Vicinamibacterales bacterium]